MNKYCLVCFYSLLITILFLSCSDQTTRVDEDHNEEPPLSQFSHKQPPGSSNEAFITQSEYDQLVVEIHYMPGAEPDENSIENLRDFIILHLEKSSITILDPKEIPSGEQDSYTASEVRDLEEQYRENYTEGSTLASYAIFLDGEYDTENVLGIAYYNTSTAYFGETVNRISGGLGQPSRIAIESTVFKHEFGHLLGLVNNGTDARDEEHHDSENGAHCTVQECLMYYSVNTTDFFANLFGGTIPELDEFCIADVEALK